MKVQVVCALLVAGFAVAALDAAQARPVFTGTWTFVADKSSPGNQPALGAEIRITHQATALVLELPVTEFVKDKNGTSKTVDLGPGSPMSYTIDGIEHVLEPQSPLWSTRDGRTMFNYIAGGPYRASWKDSSLVIASSDVIPRTSQKDGFRTDFAYRLITTTFSMNQDGTLIVERSIEQDLSRRTTATKNPDGRIVFDKSTERDAAFKAQFDFPKTALKSFYRKAS